MIYNSSALKKLLDLDKIRISKLLEISQYTILSIIPTVIIGKCVNKLFIDYSNKVNINKFIILMSIILNLFVYVIATFYIEKLVLVIPFYFSLDKNYKACLKNECKIGVMTSIVLFFISTQKSLMNNINLFVK